MIVQSRSILLSTITGCQEIRTTPTFAVHPYIFENESELFISRIVIRVLPTRNKNKKWVQNLFDVMPAVADWSFGHLGNARWAGRFLGPGAGTGAGQVGKKTQKTCTCTIVHELSWRSLTIVQWCSWMLLLNANGAYPSFVYQSNGPSLNAQ